MVFIGVDPGRDGFISATNHLGGVESFPMPKGSDGVDLKALHDLFKQLSYTECFCIIEEVHAIYGSAAGATFKFGYTVGATEALLIATSIPYDKVQPKQWQREMWKDVEKQKKESKSGRLVTDTKATSILAATNLYPEIDLRATARSKKPHDGKADSLLLMGYGIRNYNIT